MKIYNIKVIPVSEWDKLVTETYGKPYRFQQQDGCRPREMVEISVPDIFEYETPHAEIPEDWAGNIMCVDFEVWLNTDPEKQKDRNGWDDYKLESFWNRSFYPSLEMLINDLHKRGLLEEGEYSINLDW